MATPYKAPITLGRDDNFFTKLSVSASSFNEDCDIVIPFSTQTVTFQLETTGRIEYSFNGTTVHGDMENGKASASLTFENRVICKIWFRLASGAGTVRIEAWSIR